MEPIVVELSDKALVVAVLEEVGHDSLCQQVRVPCVHCQCQRIRQAKADGEKKHTRVTKQNIEKGKSNCPMVEDHMKTGIAFFFFFSFHPIKRATGINKQTTIEGTRRLRLHVMQSALAGLLTIA